MRQQEIIPEKKILALPIIFALETVIVFGRGYTDHTYIKEQLHLKLKLKLKVKIDAHGKKKLEFNLDDASDHFLSARRLHTRPPSCSTRARLVAPSNYNTSCLR